MKVQGWNPLFLVIVVAAAFLSLVANQGEQAALGQQAGPTPVATETPAANAMAVDALPGGAVDSTTTVTGSAPFEVDIVITDASTSYRGYQYKLEWDPAVLAFDAAVDLKPAGLQACLKPFLWTRSSVWGSCAGSDVTTRFVGAVTTVRLHCIPDGVSPLHLAAAAGDPLATTAFDVFGDIDTTLTDAFITCRNVGPPAPTPVPPANDNFVNAKAVRALPFRDSIGTAGATREVFEPSSCSVGDATVWYKYTADTAQFVQADTLGSNFDTALAIHTGASLDSLTIVTCDDDSDGLQSKVTAKLDGGQTYYFQVGGFSGYSGSLVFHLKTVPPPPLPVPNAFAVDAISGGGIDPTRTVIGTAPFDIDLRVTDASQPYQGYQYTLEWDPAVLAYDVQTDLRPADLGLCAAPSPTDSAVYAGCVRTEGETRFVGPVSTATFHCVADGTSRLHLRTRAEDLNFFTLTVGSGSTEFDTVLTDASITCLGVGEAIISVSPTPRPVPPDTGTGGFLDGR